MLKTPNGLSAGIEIGNVKADMPGAWTQLHEDGFCDLGKLMTILYVARSEVAQSSGRWVMSDVKFDNYHYY